MNELAAVFGSENVDAAAVTPEGRGAPGSRLRELFDAHAIAKAVWFETHGESDDLP